MARPILSSAKIDPKIRSDVESRFEDTVREVIAAVERDDIVVVGMAQNPFVRRARKALNAAGREFTYLEYGSYLKEWRRRTAIKMWSGYHTFPHVFVRGVLVGGAEELESLIQSGELEQRVQEPRS